MVVMPGRFGELDGPIAEVGASTSLGDVGAALLSLKSIPTVQDVTFHWWRRGPLRRAPDWCVPSYGDPEDLALLIAGDTWATMAPQSLWSGVIPNRVMVVHTPVIGRLGSLGALTARLCVDQSLWLVRNVDWTSRFLLLATIIQGKAEELLVSTASIRLAPREIECLGLAAKGLKAKQIAIRLGIGQQTVQFHLSRARLKLEAGNTVEAVARSMQLGIVRPGT